MKKIIFISLLIAFLSIESFAQSENMCNPPLVLEDAVKCILSSMDAESIETVENTAEEDLILFHHGWGTGIRNEFGLWRENIALLESVCGNPDCHPDGASMGIIRAVWNSLHDLPIREGVDSAMPIEIEIQRVEQEP